MVQKWGDGNLRDGRKRETTEDEDDDRFLPDDDRDNRGEDEMYISPALRALMNKYVLCKILGLLD